MRTTHDIAQLFYWHCRICGLSSVSFRTEQDAEDAYARHVHEYCKGHK